MSKLNEYIIDYKLIQDFNVLDLMSLKILPLQKFDLYTLVAICEESSLSSWDSVYQTPIKTISVNQNDILLHLNEFHERYKIFDLAKSSLLGTSSQSYIDKFFEYLLEFAISKNASDIHFESSDDALLIKYRIDGILLQFFKFDLDFYPIVSSVIKLFSKLDITQKRIPMNGRFSKEISNHLYDFRVSVMPTICGESIVIRILNKKNVEKNISELGLDEQTLEVIKEKITYSQGMILVTGPTGSGKTTTLYSILKLLSMQAKKIITIEDPVEYKLPHIQQVAINNEIGLTFSKILKNILRQDPDVLMIGEIRDKESLDVAIQASLTGHLVLATLHTNDAISTINRLLDLQAEPYLIASTLKTIISQRLVLKLCDVCKVQCDNDSYENFGCPKCNLTGYKDRVVISELFVMDEFISSMISNQSDINEIITYCKSKGFKTLFENGMQKVKEGCTSKQEIYKATSY
ncbi:MAG: type II/IV secretion system protein [Campylobacteraceae bacterium]|nr:type II/IV secretion system protein [Campylobacteraceae bacterium]